MEPSHITGQAGETAACEYLTQHGYTILCRNFRAAHDEIDIIAESDTYIVFVEVKTRTAKTKSAYGRPASSVTARKRACLARAAQAYIRTRHTDKFYRFDVIEVLLCHKPVTGEGYYDINHMRGVFGAGGKIWI